MLVLASASPRRSEILTQGGFTFTIAPAHIDESLRPDESPIAYVTRLAGEKSQAIWTKLSAQASGIDPILVLGADTTVVAPDGEILGKPCSEADAARMLKKLSGATHKVITGVALASELSLEAAAEVTYVTMLTLSEAEIAAYVATGDPMDKAGAYGIQGYAARWIPRIHGCYFNVMGLPLALVSTMIEGAQARAHAESDQRVLAK